MTEGEVLRFFIKASDGQRSMSWRVWTGDPERPTDELYFAPRHMAGELKGSLHRSGYGQMGPTKRLRDKSPAGARKAISRWAVSPTGGQLVRLMIHRTELRPAKHGADELGIEMPDDADCVSLLLISPETPACTSGGAKVVGRLKRKSLDPIVLVLVPTPPMPQVVVHVHEDLRNSTQTQALAVDWPSVPWAVAEMHSADGVPIFVEIAP